MPLYESLKSGATSMPDDDIPLALSKIPPAAKAIEVVTSLARDAFVDAKTLLLNEAALNVLTKEYSAAGADAKLAVIFIDLLGFKHINTILGYIGGDAALRAVANVILELVHDANADCFRQHGDEFLIFLPAETVESIVHLAEQQLSSVPVEYGGKKVNCGVTIGYCAGEPQLSIDALIKGAQDACSIAKEMGSKSAVAWHSEIEKERIDQDRQRCGVCFATTTLIVRVSQRQQGSLSSCANCGAPFGN